MSNRRLVYCLATGASLAGPLGLAAQAPLARLTVGGGSATDLRGVRSGAYTLAPSLPLFPAANLTLGLGGRTTRYTNDEWSLGGSGGLNARVPLGPRLAFGLGASGDAVHASYHATYLQADATPALELRLGPLAVWGGAHGAVAQSTFRPSLEPPHRRARRPLALRRALAQHRGTRRAARAPQAGGDSATCDGSHPALDRRRRGIAGGGGGRLESMAAGAAPARGERGLVSRP